MLCPVLESLTLHENRFNGESPVQDHEDYKGAGASFIQGEAESWKCPG